MNYFEYLFLAVSILSLILSIVSITGLSKLQKLRKEFFIGDKAANLEQFILNQNNKLNDLVNQAQYIEEAVKNLREQQKISIQKMGVIRYNPFNDNGGNLSFSIAIMDGKDNGVVITSMHGREVNRIYAKPIKNSKSDFGLTEEEQKAITSASNF